MEDFPSCSQDGTGSFSPQLGLHILSMGLCAALFVVHTLKFFRNWQNNPAVSDDEPAGVLAAEQQGPNTKRCVRCCTDLSLPNKQKSLCDKCKFVVCRQCSQWNPDQQVWTCKFCCSPESSPSPEWLQKKLLDRCRVSESTRRSRSLKKVFDEYEQDNENDSGYHPSMSIGSEGSGFGEPTQDPVLMEVHENVEAIVEQLVGDSIESTTLDPLCCHPEYERMMEIYHGRLRDALNQLIQSLRLALNGQPLATDQTPTSSYSALKYVISEVIEEAMGLPYLRGTDNHTGPLSPFVPSEDEDDLDSKSYEEILAIAILNKIIDRHQQAKHKLQSSTYASSNLRETNNNYGQQSASHLTNKEIQTDLETNGESSITKGNESQMTHYSPSMDFSEDEYSFGTESASEDFSWAQGAGERSPSVQYTVEEQIEEITTTVENAPNPKSRCIEAINEPVITQTILARNAALPDLSYYCAGFEFAESRKVPFPELGMDLVDGDCIDDDDVEQNVSALVSAITNWQDNWLFRKKRSITPFRNMGDIVIGEEPVAMLVPNPQIEVRAKIGNRDIDELSDMSERNSEGGSEGFSSTESDDRVEENILEEQEELDANDVDHRIPQCSTVPELPLMTVTNVISTTGLDSCKRSAAVSNVESSQKPFLDQEPRHTSDESFLPGEVNRMQTKLTVPVPAPRKSKSSICSDEDRSSSSCRPEDLPVFVPPASRRRSCPDVQFDMPPGNCSVLSGRTACIKCGVIAAKPYGVAWFHGHELMDERLSRQFGDEHILEIYDVQESDAGTYSCVAYCCSGETWVDFRMDVRSSKSLPMQPKFQQRLSDCTLEEGESLALSCKVFGVPEPRLSWFKDGQRIKENERLSLDQSGSGGWILRVDRAVSADSGSYSVIAENKRGAVQSAAEVLVVPCDGLKVKKLTDRANQAQDCIYREAEKMMESVNQLSSLNRHLEVLDKQVKRLEIRFQQRTWAERQAEIKRDALHHVRGQQEAANAVRQTTGDALDLIAAVSDCAQNQSPKPNDKISYSRKNLQLDLSRPDVIPGSIADREHRKWQHAVELPNNPYSPENIAKRSQNINRLSRMSRHSDQEATPLSPENGSDHDLMIRDGPTKIDCGLKVIDPRNSDPHLSGIGAKSPAESKKVDPPKYRRDYYVNSCHSTNGRPAKRSDSLPRPCSTDVALNSVEEKVYISSGRVYALEDKINNIESQVKNVNEETSAVKVSVLEDKVARAVAQVAQNEKQVSKVEQEVARLQMEFLQKQQGNVQGSDAKCTLQVTMMDNSGSVEQNLKSDWKSDWKASQDECQSEDTTKVGSFRTISSEDGRAMNLPSVRALATKFDGPAFQSGLFSNGSYEHKDDGTTVVKIDPKKPSAKPRGKRVNGSRPMSTDSSITSGAEAWAHHSSSMMSSSSDCSTLTTPKVHSLTARSLPQEFREAAQRHMPKPLNRNIAFPASDQDGSGSSTQSLAVSATPTADQAIKKGTPTPLEQTVTNGHTLVHEDGAGYTSDESSTSTSSLPKVRPLKKLSRSIQDRAAFWDRRVREDRMTDPSMCEEFPPMALPST